MKNKLLDFLRIFIICFIVSLIVQFAVNGIPLFDLPDLEEIEYAEITDITSNKAIIIKPDSDKFEMARNTPGVLRINIGKPVSDNYKYSFKYTLKNGNIIEIYANENSVLYKGKSYKLRSKTGELFCNISEGYFFSMLGN